MSGDLPALIDKYRPKGILLDSNLLVLLYVGLVGPHQVREFKRTCNQGFTETSNYLCQWTGPARARALQLIAETVQSFRERRPEARNLVQTGAFFDFGLTDSAVLDLPPKKYLVPSVDAKLVVALQRNGVDAINFNRLRQLAWQL